MRLNCFFYIDKNEDDMVKRVFDDDIRSLYNLKYDYNEDEIKFLSKDCLIKISIMAKFTKVFGNHYIFGNVSNFIENENVIFATAFLLRISLIIKRNCITVSNI